MAKISELVSVPVQAAASLAVVMLALAASSVGAADSERPDKHGPRSDAAAVKKTTLAPAPAAAPAPASAGKSAPAPSNTNTRKRRGVVGGDDDLKDLEVERATRR